MSAPFERPAPEPLSRGDILRNVTCGMLGASALLLGIAGVEWLGPTDAGRDMSSLFVDTLSRGNELVTRNDNWGFTDPNGESQNSDYSPFEGQASSPDSLRFDASDLACASGTIAALAGIVLVGAGKPEQA